MSDGTTPRVGFVGWNPFQLLHVRKLIRALPGSCFVLESRKAYVDEFDEALLDDPDVPVLVWAAAQMPDLDGVFDIIVCQTPFGRIETFRKSRLAMLQYGYAKEPHNYGAWRAFADLNLAYGPYAAEKMAHFSPALSVGNPRYDDWHDSAWIEAARQRQAAGLDPERKTVLYAPTWGELSSVETFLQAVYSLAGTYNVLVKMHHNTDLLEPARKSAMAHSHVRHLGANDDLLELLAVADVLISDFSGAIFDAMFCRKPVVLLDVDIDEILQKDKVDRFSLEFARRGEIGVAVSAPVDLPAAVAGVLANPGAAIEGSAALRAELFNDTPGATQRAVAALQALADGAFTPEQKHLYVRKEMVDLYQVKVRLAAANRKLKAGGAAKPKPAAKMGAAAKRPPAKAKA